MINRFIIQGNLTSDPEIKTSVNGKNYCNFSVACNVNKDKCHFLNVTIFGDQAENFCKWSKKGDMRIIEGEIVQDSYEKDGEKINRMKLIASRFYFAGSVGNPKASNKDDDMLF